MDLGNASNIYRSEIAIGNKKKTIVVINHDGEKPASSATVSKTVDKVHHIHVLDRSGSMYGEIGNLIEDVKKTVDMIDENDYISVVWFSSPGQYKTLIKGARKTDDVNKLLDSIKSTLGCTCFSDPLKEVGVIINDLKAMCPNFSVTLFTDGQPVVPWGEDEEATRMIAAINDWKEDALALNTVGYGNQYNQDLLKTISALTEFGEMVHSRDIEEYSRIFSRNFEKVRDMVVESIEITADKKVEIMYFTSKIAKLFGNKLNLRTLDKKKNQFVLIGDKDFEFEFGGQGKLMASDIGDKLQVPKNTLTPVLYAYASSKYYINDRIESLDIIGRVLRDKFLVDSHFQSFTFDECSIHQEHLNNAVFHKDGRLKDGECGEDYLPAEDALCVLDILTKLMSVEGAKYVYASNYQRIGLQSIDEFNLFEKKDGLVMTDLDGLVYNKEKLNISIQSVIPGVVRINPMQAKKVDIATEIESCIYRNQTIIKDGYLNMKEIQVWMPMEGRAKFDKWATAKGLTYSDDEVLRDGGSIYTITLAKYPTINRKYISKAAKTVNVWGIANELITLEAEQKVAKYIIKTDGEAKGKFKEYTPEQIEVLREHGLSDKLVYGGVGTKTAEKTDGDYYEARTLKFDIKGSSSIPAVEESLTKAKEGKKLNAGATAISNWVQAMNSQLAGAASFEVKGTEKEIGYANAKLREIKEKINELRAEQFGIKLSIVLTGSWFSDVTPDGKGNYTYEKDGVTLVIKADREKVYF